MIWAVGYIIGHMTALTPKRERFVQHFVITGSASEAARLAGYAANSAKQEGSRLLTFADMRSAVDMERARLRETTDLRAEDVVNGLLQIARDDDAPHRVLSELSVGAE